MNWYKKSQATSPLEEAVETMDTMQIKTLNQAWSYLVDDRSHGNEYLSEAASAVYADMFERRPGDDFNTSREQILEYMRRSFELGRKYLEEA